MVYRKRIGSIELRHLRYFIATAELGSVTKAAGRIGIQQPPLSQQLRALETAIGASLLKRTSRGMELTKAGEHLYRSAKTILGLVDDAVESTRRVGLGKQGHLRVGYTSSAAFHPFVPEALSAFRQFFPDVTLNLNECCTAELLEILQAGQVDAAFVRAPLDGAAGLIVEPILEEPILIALPAEHPLVRRRHRASMSLTALANETLLLYRRKPGPGLYETIVAACRKSGFSPRIGQETPGMIGALNLVASGLGISLVPESMQRINSETICYVHLEAGFGLTAPIHLAYRRDAVSPSALLFIDQVRARLGEMKAVEKRALAHALN
jgi:DNA-binding transcriptional LysR family regulator